MPAKPASRRFIAAAAALVLAMGAAGGRATAAAPASPAPVTVKVFFPRGAGGRDCARVLPRPRAVPGPAVLAGAIRALLSGPTAAERRLGYGGWFSRTTSGMLRSASIRGGVAHLDFRDFSRLIPNASSSCGGTLLLAQLDRTATQFPAVREAVYSFDGSRRAFYEWLQREPPVR